MAGEAALRMPPIVGLLLFFFVVMGGRMYWDDVGGQRPVQRWYYMRSFGFCVFLYLLISNLKKMRYSCKEATLTMSRLNHAMVVKELFWNYLQAALMEPMVAIASRAIDLSKGTPASLSGEKGLVMHVLMLLSLLWWTYIITDAFDESDTEQEFKFRGFAKDFQDRRFSGAQMLSRDDTAWLTTIDTEESSVHMGSWFHDLALWWVMTCIASAFFGLVKHTDVWHAYVLMILWIFLHHVCNRATCWGANYFISMLMPSAALLPVQFCLLLRKAESLEDLEDRREFVRARCGVRLQIVTEVVHATATPKAS